MYQENKKQNEAKGAVAVESAPTSLVNRLRQAGIRAAEYKRGPFGRDVFALSIQPRHSEGTVTVNQGTAGITVRGDKARRQAVVSVIEKDRVVVRNTAAHFSDRLTASVELGDRPSIGEIHRSLRENFTAIMPVGTSWSYGRCSYSSTEQVSYGQQTTYALHVKCKVTARVNNQTTNHFLIGMDETRNFIAALPDKPRSVKHAHKMLRPARLRKDSLRQGEWFFEPIRNAKLKTQLSRFAIILKPTRLENTTHHAKTAIKYNGVLYAIGFITDDRRGHHAPTLLKDWHKVVRNKEATIKVSPAQRERVVRMRRTWD
jgi:hypothetical protein